MAALVEACIARPRLLAPMCRIKQRSGDSSIYKPGQANALRSLALPRAVGSDGPARGQTIGSRSPAPACQLAPRDILVQARVHSHASQVLTSTMARPSIRCIMQGSLAVPEYASLPSRRRFISSAPPELTPKLAGAWHTVRLQIDFGPVANDDERSIIIIFLIILRSWRRHGGNLRRSRLGSSPLQSPAAARPPSCGSRIRSTK